MKEEKEGARVNLFENFDPYIYFVNGLIVFSRLFLSSFLFEGSIGDSKERLLKILGSMEAPYHSFARSSIQAILQTAPPLLSVQSPFSLRSVSTPSLKSSLQNPYLSLTRIQP